MKVINKLFSSIIPISCFGYQIEDEEVKNEDLYCTFKVGGMPCYWYSEKTCVKWNRLIRKCCNQLPEMSNDFTRPQKMKIIFKYCFLLIYDKFTK